MNWASPPNIAVVPRNVYCAIACIIRQYHNGDRKNTKYLSPPLSLRPRWEDSGNLLTWTTGFNSLSSPFSIIRTLTVSYVHPFRLHADFWRLCSCMFLTISHKYLYQRKCASSDIITNWISHEMHYTPLTSCLSLSIPFLSGLDYGHTSELAHSGAVWAAMKFRNTTHRTFNFEIVLVRACDTPEAEAKFQHLK